MKHQTISAIGALLSVFLLSQQAHALRPVHDCRGALLACNKTCTFDPDSINQVGDFERAVQKQAACNLDCQDSYDQCVATWGTIYVPPLPPTPPPTCLNARCVPPVTVKGTVLAPGGTGKTAGRVKHNEFQITKTLDKASVGFFP